MRSRRWNSLPCSTACLALLLGLAAAGARAATPATGTVSEANPTVTWTGPLKTATAGGCGNDANASCDNFKLTISPPSAAYGRYVVEIRLLPVGDWDLEIYDPARKEIKHSGNGPNALEIAQLYNPVAGTYTMAAAAFAPLAGPDGVSYTASAQLKKQPPSATATPGTDTPGFSNHAWPSGGAASMGEPSIGANWKTGKILFAGGGFPIHVLRVTFNDTTNPPQTTWDDVSPVLVATPRAFSDPILFTDPKTGRTFACQLEGLTPFSTTAFSDDDGALWIPSQGSGIASGIDHQTFGGGPYAPPLTRDPAGPVYPNTVYYCAQELAAANCARSDDGGATFGPAVTIYTSECGGLHGHVKVAPDGTVYVPNESCGGSQGIAVSEDNGLTWDVRTIPGSGKGDSDPSVGIATDGTVYFGFQDGDGHPKIAVSHDKGRNWVLYTGGARFQDVGVPFGIQNTVFSAVVAGEPNRAAFAFLGTPTAGAMEDASFTGVWHLYVAFTYDGGGTWTTIDATPNDPVQRGCVWLQGGSNPCRNMLDFMDATVDQNGRVVVGYADGCTGSCSTNPSNITHTAWGTIARQSAGRRMYAAFDPQTNLTPTTTALSSSPNPSSAGQAVTFTATVSAASGIPTGPVAFKEGAATLGTGTLDASGRAAFTTSALAAGNHSVTAAYGGDTAFASSASAPLTQTVNAVGNPNCTGVLVVSDGNVNDAADGQANHDVVSATVSNPYTGDTVPDRLVFKIKVASLATLTPGSIYFSSFTVDGKPEAAGNVYGVRMTVGPTGATSFESYLAGASNGGTVDGRFVSGTPLAAESGSNYNPDGTITIIVKPANVGVTAPIAGHTLTVFNGAAAQTVNGIITAILDWMPAGGDGFVDETPPARSDTVFTVQSNQVCKTGGETSDPACTTPGVTAVADNGTNDATDAQAIHDIISTSVAYPYASDSAPDLLVFTIKVGSLAALTPSTFYYTSFTVDGRPATAGNVFGVRMNVGSTGTPTFESYVAGASNSGAVDGRFAGAILAAESGSGYTPAGTITIIVKPSNVGLTAPGQALTGFNGAVAATAAGVATAILDEMPAALARVGSFTVRSNQTCRPSNGQAATATALASSANPSAAGSPVTFTATVTSSASGTPTGAVLFKDGSTTLGTAGLNGSAQAGFTTSTLSPGTHSITAAYGGDASFVPSTSAAVSQVVQGTLTGTPRYHDLPSPPALGNSAAEPSIGIDWNPNVASLKHDQVNTGGVVFYTSGPQELRASFDDCASPAKTLWEDVSSPFVQQAPLSDPIGVVDHTTGRVFYMDLIGGEGNSFAAFSDDDGNTFLPMQGGGAPAGPDHQSLGVGPYNENAFPPPPPHPLYPHAVYYCSQNIVGEAEISRSDDGGITFGPSVLLFNPQQCVGGIHGHIKVAPDGTVYVPNFSCSTGSGTQGIAVSTDNGVTWVDRTVPDSNGPLGLVDPSLGIGSGGTIYLGWQGGDGHPYVAFSRDRGVNWSAPVDVGATLGLRAITFPVVTAGDDDRAAFGFLGTTGSGDYQDEAGFRGIWHFYVATTFDRGQSWTTVDATPDDPVQVGSICNHGTLDCGNDRNLLDFNDITIDREGRVVAAYADGCVAPFCTANSQPGDSRRRKASIIRQSGGRRLLAAFDPPATARPGSPIPVALSDSTGVHVSWPAPDDGGSTISSYNVFRRTEGSGQKVLIANVAARKYDDTGFDPAKTNYYSITSINALGESTACAGGETVPVPAPTPCRLPGISLVTDPALDGAPPDPTLDIRELFIAEPAGSPDRMVFTMTVSSLAVIFPNHQWYVIWDPPGGGLRKYVAAVTDATGALSYQYGHIGPPLDATAPSTDANKPFPEGVADAGAVDQANGTITITIANSKVGSPAAGQALATISPRTFAGNGTTNVTGSTAADITATTPSYVLAGNGSCAPQASTATALASSANPSAFGQPVTFTATVTSQAPGTPTGTVAFKDGAASLGTGTLNASGRAAFTTATLTAGSHAITAVYAGDPNFAGSASAVLSQAVGAASSATALSSSPNPSGFGQSVTFTATVAGSGGTPTGTVTFKEGAATLGSAALDGSGRAAFSTAALAVGDHAITAAYGGDAGFAPSASAAVTQSVQAAAPAAPITFSRSALADLSAISGEPFLKVDKQDNIFVSSPFGTSTSVSLIWKSVDGGRSFIPLGSPILRDPVLGPGGGDTHQDFDDRNRLYFVDLSLGCVTAAVSEDGGNSWPPDRTNFLTCIGEGEDPTGAQDDRQWIAAFGDGIAYMTVRNFAVGVGGNFHLSKTTDGGKTWHAQIIGTVGQSGPLQIDKSLRRVVVNGVAKNAILLYQPYYTGTNFRVFRITDTNDGSPLIVENFSIVNPGASIANVFPVLAVDKAGNLYAAWSQSANTIYLATSQDRGQTWSSSARVNPTSLSGTNVMPWIVAGDPGRVDIVWYRTAGANNASSVWDVHMAQSLDALGPAPTFNVTRVNEDTIHTGEICLDGLNCDIATAAGNPRDRSFLEFPSIGVTSRGSAAIVFNQSSNQVNGAYVMVATQAAGPGLFVSPGRVESGTGSVTLEQPSPGQVFQSPAVTFSGKHTLPPGSFDRDEKGDARFPDHGTVIGPSIPAFDIQQVTAADNSQDFTLTLQVGDTTATALATAPPQAGGDGLLYVAQWESKGTVYWVGAEMRAGQPTFLTGTLGVIRSATSKKLITYNPDLTASQQVRGQIVAGTPGTITLTIPRSLIGNPANGTSLYWLTAYALSERGPLVPVGSSAVPDPTSLPIHVDAAGSFIYIVGAGPQFNGVVEVSLDDPSFASPRTVSTAGTGDSWQLALTAPDLTFGPHTAYARQRITGYAPSPAVSVSFNVNRPPAAQPVSATTAEDTAKSIALAATDDDDGSTMTLALLSAPSKGTLGSLGAMTCTASGGVRTCTASVTYTPAANFNGSDSFTYKATDSFGSVSSPATVSITVTPVNDAPSADNKTASTPQGTPSAITLTGSDIDNASVSFSIVAAPLHGSLGAVAAPSCSASGSGSTCSAAVTYTPATGYTGADSFTYRTSDGAASSGTATVSITVTPGLSGKTSGSGEFAVTNPDGVSSFGFTVTRKVLGGPVSGNMHYFNHARNLQAKATSITFVNFSGTGASFGGACVKGSNNTPCTYTVTVDDIADPGKGFDKFTIAVSGEPAEGGVISKGNIQVRTP